MRCWSICANAIYRRINVVFIIYMGSWCQTHRNSKFILCKGQSKVNDKYDSNKNATYKKRRKKSNYYESTHFVSCWRHMFCSSYLCTPAISDFYQLRINALNQNNCRPRFVYIITNCLETHTQKDRFWIQFIRNNGMSCKNTITPILNVFKSVHKSLHRHQCINDCKSHAPNFKTDFLKNRWC